MNKLNTIQEHMKTLGSISRFCMVLAKVNKSDMQCDKRSSDSAIAQHFFKNGQCALNYDNKRFLILATASISFHLNLLEAAYIKTQRPVLSRQKEFVYILKLFQ